MGRGAATEAGLVGLLGAVCGFGATWWLDLGYVGAALGAINGAAAGWQGIYDWSRPAGWLALLADSTWGLVGTTAGLGFGALNLLRADRDHVGDFCRRRGYHVFAGGIGLRRDFALAIGNVIANAGGRVGLRGESERAGLRRRFVIEHEGLHVLQNRLFGPLFPLLYLGWVIGAGLVGLVLAAIERRWAVVETLAYYDNPFEYWAYRNNRYWPPRGAVAKYAWRARR